MTFGPKVSSTSASHVPISAVIRTDMQTGNKCQILTLRTITMKVTEVTRHNGDTWNDTDALVAIFTKDGTQLPELMNIVMGRQAGPVVW